MDTVHTFAVTLTCTFYLFRYIFNISYENMNFEKLRCSRVNKFYLKEKKGELFVRLPHIVLP